MQTGAMALLLQHATTDGSDGICANAWSAIRVEAPGSVNIRCMSAAACFINRPSIMPASAVLAGSTPSSISLGAP